MTTATARPHQNHLNQPGEQNRQVLDTLAIATRAARALVSQGFTVLTVSLERDSPRLRIRYSRRCARLRGVSAAVRGGPLGRDLIMVAQLHGAQVEWIVKGH